MLPFQPTTTIQYGEQTFALDKMSDRIKQLVAYLDDWRQKEASMASDLLMVRAAMSEIQNTIKNALDEERAEAQRKAESMGIIPPNDNQTEAQ